VRREGGGVGGHPGHRPPSARSHATRIGASEARRCSTMVAAVSVSMVSTNIVRAAAIG
jgi:hypothetical protein